MSDDHHKKDRGGKDSHYARLRRQHRDRNPVVPTDKPQDGRVWLYGLHTVRAALRNPQRHHYQLWLTRNAAQRLELDLDALPCPAEIVHPQAIDAKLGSDAVHQGVVLECKSAAPFTLEDIKQARLVIVLDQVTDPHNVGALMRSAVAMNADALVTTARHSPTESGTLAKAASGALEHLTVVQVRNLANALTELSTRGFQTIGLDSEGPADLESSICGARIALVMGGEGKGLREKTRMTVNTLARLDMPGPIRSLNVSNAAVLALYIAHRHFKGTGY